MIPRFPPAFSRRLVQTAIAASMFLLATVAHADPPVGPPASPPASPAPSQTAPMTLANPSAPTSVATPPGNPSATSTPATSATSSASATASAPRAVVPPPAATAAPARPGDPRVALRPTERRAPTGAAAYVPWIIAGGAAATLIGIFVANQAIGPGETTITVFHPGSGAMR